MTSVEYMLEEDRISEQVKVVQNSFSVRKDQKFKRTKRLKKEMVDELEEIFNEENEEEKFKNEDEMVNDQEEVKNLSRRSMVVKRDVKRKRKTRINIGDDLINDSAFCLDEFCKANEL